MNFGLLVVLIVDGVDHGFFNRLTVFGLINVLVNLLLEVTFDLDRLAVGIPDPAGQRVLGHHGIVIKVIVQLSLVVFQELQERVIAWQTEAVGGSVMLHLTSFYFIFK